MSGQWLYLAFIKEGDNEGEIKTPMELWPPEGSVFLAYECLRARVVVGFRERRIGCLSILDPNVDDDANIAAIAPLWTTEPPDLAEIYARVPESWRQRTYKPSNEDTTIWMP